MDVVREGEVLAGKYRVERVLGQGGMGIVVAAQHVQLGQRVALKFLLPHACSSAEAVARFLREGRAAVQIQSEHVARVTDVGQLETGAPYMVMEFLKGSDLTQILEQRGPLPISEAVDHVLQASEAIAEAHSLGIVHRDLKPANLFLARRPDGSALVKVLDFGISKAAQTDATGAPVNLTSTSAMMGSPLYMSPEQVRNVKDVDARTDIWSLGVILHELLTGAAPFVADTAPALFAMITADPPIPLRQRRPDAPPQLEAVLLRCLEKDRSRRYSSVADFARALQPFGSRDSAVSADRISRILGVSTHEAPGFPSHAPPSLGVPAATGGTMSEWGRTGGTRRGSRAGVVFAVVSTIALAVGAGTWFFVRGAGHETVEATAASPSVGETSTAASPPTTPVAQPLPPLPEPIVAVAPASAVAAANPSAVASAPIAVRPVRAKSPRATPAPAPAATAKPRATEPPAPAPKRAKDLFDDTQ